MDELQSLMALARQRVANGGPLGVNGANGGGGISVAGVGMATNGAEFKLNGV